MATEWPEFLSLDLAVLRERMRGDLFVDGRNNFDPGKVQRAGFHYLGIGRRSAAARGRMHTGSNMGVAAL